MRKIYVLPLTTQIEVVATKGTEVFKKIMIYDEALKTPKKKGWIYQYFQIDFCSM